jgi:hypothetical protein
MSERIIQQVATVATADLDSAYGPLFTYVHSDGQLHVNLAAAFAQADQPRDAEDIPRPVRVHSMLFQPAGAHGAPCRGPEHGTA